MLSPTVSIFLTVLALVLVVNAVVAGALLVHYWREGQRDR